MHISVVWVDVEPYLQTKEQPVMIVPREARAWYTLANDGLWHTQLGEFARIPIHAYRVMSVEPQYLLAAGMEKAIQFLGTIREDIPQVRFDEVLLFVGRQVHTEEETMRFYVGFAVTADPE